MVEIVYRLGSGDRFDARCLKLAHDGLGGVGPKGGERMLLGGNQRDAGFGSRRSPRQDEGKLIGGQRPADAARSDDRNAADRARSDFRDGLVEKARIAPALPQVPLAQRTPRASAKGEQQVVEA